MSSQIHLKREQQLAWGINNINGILLLGTFPEICGFPIGKGGRTLDSNALFSLQVHTIHLCANRVAPTDLRKKSVFPLLG